MTYNNEENEANRLLNPLEATSQTGETTATETSEASTQEPAPFEESENEESASGAETSETSTQEPAPFEESENEESASGAETSETSTQEKKDDEPTLLSIALALLMFALFVMVACKVVKSGLDFGYDLYKSREPFEYRIDYGVATITKYKGKRSRVGVPAEIKGKPVVAIGDGAFSYCGLITEITLPNGLERIESNAFSFCRRLRKLTLPESVQIIDDSASLPDWLKEDDDDHAFSSCAVDLTLYVAAGSYAEEYARENDIRFEVRNASAAATNATP